jgi:hypothetical protein
VAKIPDIDPWAPPRPLSPFEQARDEIVAEGRRQREAMEAERRAAMGYAPREPMLPGRGPSRG